MEKHVLSNYYKECERYLDRLGVEVDINAKKEIAARLLLAAFDFQPILNIRVRGGCEQ